MAENAVRIFLDTNVLLSGFLSMTGAPRLILDVLASDQSFVEAATGQYNILEIERNLERKLLKAVPIYKEVFAKIRLTIVPLPTSEEMAEARWAAGATPKDFPVLVSAASWRADFLVTGDKKHFDGLKAGSEGISEAKSVSGSAGISEAKSVSGSAGGIPFRIINPAELVDNVLPEAFGKMRGSKSL
jgi:predicted nucleic acid-binding protein